MNNQIEHPSHYGGEDNVYEAIKVIEAWDLGFCLANVIKYISRNGKKSGESDIKDLKKALWYLDREIQHRVRAKAGNELQIEEASQEGNGPTFEDFKRAKKVRVIKTKGFTYHLDVGGEYEVNMSDNHFMVSTVGSFDKKNYLGNGLFKWPTGTEIKLEIVE